MTSIADLRLEAVQALDTVWFVRSVEEIEHTDITLSIRLHIRSGLFVQVFYGDRSDSLYFALIEGNRLIFGIDRERGRWHRHPFGASDLHEPLVVNLEPRPLLTFLSRVEDLLLTQDLL